MKKIKEKLLFVLIASCIIVISISITGCNDDGNSGYDGTGLEPSKLWNGSFNINRYNLKDVDSLVNFYEGGYNEISGGIRIVKIDSLEVDIIGMLINLQKINGNFNIIDACSRTNFKGLEKLQEIGGDLIIEDCPSLLNLEGLENLQKADKIELYNNPKLSSLNGLNGVNEIGEGGLSIKYCPIKNFEGLDNLTKIAGWLDIYKTNITNLKGMPLLEELSFVYIFYTTIKNLEGFESVKTISGTLGLKFNNSLVNLVGLTEPAINSFDIDYNDSLTSLKGIEGVLTTGDSTSGAMNSFVDNPLLDDFSAMSDAFIQGISHRYWSCSGNKYNPTMEDMLAGRKTP